MSITAGQDIVTTDFINESERDATPANDAGRVPKLDADGSLSLDFLRDYSVRVKRTANLQLNALNVDEPIPWTAEDFDTDTMHATTEGTPYNETTNNAEETSNATTDWFAQQFATGADQYALGNILLYLRHTVDSSNSFEVVLRSSLTGSDLASSGVRAFDPASTAITAVNLRLSPYKLTPSTTYYIVMKTMTFPASGTFVMRRNSAGSGGWRTDDSGVSWTAVTGGYVMTIGMNASSALIVPAAGKYLAIANINCGTGAARTIKLWKNNVVILGWVEGAGDNETGVSFSSLVELAESDFVSLTFNIASSSPNDILFEGSSFELIRFS